MKKRLLIAIILLISVLLSYGCASVLMLFIFGNYIRVDTMYFCYWLLSHSTRQSEPIKERVV